VAGSIGLNIYVCCKISQILLLLLLLVMALPIPLVFFRKSKFLHCLSYTLIYYIQKRNYFCRRYKLNKSEYYYSKYFKYRKLIKIAIKFDRLKWYKSIDKDISLSLPNFGNTYHHLQNTVLILFILT